MPAAGVTLSLISYIGTAIAFVFATLSLGKPVCHFQAREEHSHTHTHAHAYASDATRNRDEETLEENQETRERNHTNLCSLSLSCYFYLPGRKYFFFTIACGLYYLAELVEEYTVLTKKIIKGLTLVRC